MPGRAASSSVGGTLVVPPILLNDKKHDRSSVLLLIMQKLVRDSDGWIFRGPYETEGINNVFYFNLKQTAHSNNYVEARNENIVQTLNSTFSSCRA